ncbi:MAG: cadherin-like beta sandwich domain-containing protein [Roseburia sp.]
MNKITQKIKIFAALLVLSLALTGGGLTVYAGSADNSLASLTLSEGSLSPSFQGSQLQYTATVGADTTSVEVNAKPVNSAASVIEISGNTDLAVGQNKIQVVVQAENGNLATYTITVTRPETAAAAAEEPQEQPQQTQQEQPQQTVSQEATSDEEDAEQTGEATGSMVSDESDYVISDDFTQEQIPEDFTQVTVTYQGEEHNGLLCSYADITLVYMTNGEEEGAFFIYDAASEDTYPFIRLSSENSSVILLRQAAPTEEYAPADIVFGDMTFNSAYQLAQGDFYQVYGVNNSGVAGWYQYDAAEGTYQRYTVVDTVEETTGSESEYLQQALGDLNDKYTARKNRDMKIIAVLIVVCVILLFVILNLLLRGRRRNQEESDDFFDDEDVEKLDELTFIEEDQLSAEPETIPDEALTEKTPVQPKEEDWSEDEEFSDFEEEPQLLSGRKTKRERKKKERREKVRDIFDDDDSQNSIFEKEKIYSEQDSDDDFEVMDLNDL